MDPQESAPQTTLDWLSCFCTAQPCAQHTDRHTTCDICSSRPHLCACERCGLIMFIIILSACEHSVLQ